MQGIFLVSHGSSALRSWQAIQAVADILRELCPHLPIGAGCLEGLDRSLSVQITEFIDITPQLREVLVIPLFLIPGNHVMVDLPQAVAQVPQSVPITIAPYLGSLKIIPTWLEHKFAVVETTMNLGTTRRVIISHGSNYPQAELTLQQLAHHLHAQLTLWTQRENILHTITSMLSHHHSHILVLPYFLLAGKTTDLLHALLSPYQDRVTVLPLPFDYRTIAHFTLQHLILPLAGV